jgi:hypothetical protein
LNEAQAISQFITIPDNEKCPKCGRRIEQGGDIFTDAPIDTPHVQVCEMCFDSDLRSRNRFF